jgi:hypothetical protein
MLYSCLLSFLGDVSLGFRKLYSHQHSESGDTLRGEAAALMEFERYINYENINDIAICNSNIEDGCKKLSLSLRLSSHFKLSVNDDGSPLMANSNAWLSWENRRFFRHLKMALETQDDSKQLCASARPKSW